MEESRVEMEERYMMCLKKKIKLMLAHNHAVIFMYL